jgi:hypothetical protein
MLNPYNCADSAIVRFLRRLQYEIRYGNWQSCNFSGSLKYVTLKEIYLSYGFDFTPLKDIELVKIASCHCLIDLQGLGKTNKTVTIIDCDILDFSALKTVPRVIIHYCYNFKDCEDLNQVHLLTIIGVFRWMDLRD